MEKKIVNPEVGMGVTMSINGDCYPYEIVKVIDEKHLAIRRMDYKATPDSDPYGEQKYIYVSRPDSPLCYLTLRNNRWREQITDAEGKPTRRLGSKWEHWHIGSMCYYFDPHF